jgi:FKBP-type peptidyl-prolyl cis-trans isomerase
MINRIASILILLSFWSCRPDPQPQHKTFKEGEVKEVLVEINKNYIEKEDIQIDDYLRRRSWDFNRTASGLRYLIYQQGIGNKPVAGQTVVLEYEISLIRGEVIYSSQRNGPKQFVVDRSDEPSGLHEAVKLMKVGDKAKVVLPSYLAYGLLGDEDKIPTKATLFYDLYLKEVR